ncbi:heme-binding-like protein At3g10130, chloroplastic isoform X2 [Syzygium oleosum]|uniref:heme-binding-like protein At3g10130, chloroplastic isoform X2 n=1 Tax=Syzygium oleosum TaxID=219896 RepID=UPI0024BA4CC3|nr:heme-binding-like protein At3g10130, chloroplastic isoform X2 [Syzygium oleosum]
MSLRDPSSWIGPSLSRALVPTSPSPKRSRSAGCAVVRSMAADRAAASAAVSASPRRPISAFEARVTLVFALASQASSVSQRLLVDLATETAKYVFPKRFESRNLEEALMAVPDLETVKFKVLSRRDQYEIREVESYYIAETTMPGKTGFDFNGASQSFNVLAEYLFGKNTTKEQMEMTTPVYTRKSPSDGEKMEMTTPVITKKVENEGKWQMSFVMPSKYGANIPSPRDPSVRIKEVPQKIVAVVAFSGFVTDEEVKQRELKLRDALKSDGEFRIKEVQSTFYTAFYTS